MSHITLEVNGQFVVRADESYLASFTPSKTGDRRWQIIRDDGFIIDSYTPARVVRHVCTVVFETSWAGTVNKKHSDMSERKSDAFIRYDL